MIRVYIAEYSDEIPEDYRHPLFLVYGSDEETAQANAENFMIRCKNRYWSHITTREATPEDMLKILGDDRQHVHLVGGTLTVSTTKDHMDHQGEPLPDIPRERRNLVVY